MLRLSRDESALVLVDYQPRLMPAIHDGDAVTVRAAVLARLAGLLGVPTVGTQQSPEKLGPLDPALAASCVEVLDKTAFGACDDGLADLLERVRPALSQVVLAGCEAHVCLLQTALGCLADGRQVFIVEDACGSRAPRSKELALARLRQAGAVVVNTEMVAFEWVRHAGHEQFRAVSALIK